MAPSLGLLVLYLLIPAGVSLAGTAVALIREPSASARSALHHLAAGAIFAAAAGELVVELVSKKRLLALVIGFLAGAVAMLLVRVASDRIERAAGEGPRRQAGLLATIGIDVFVDGIVTGIGFALGAGSGLVFIAAFALEMAFLGATTAIELRAAGGSRRTVAAGPTTLATLLIVGGIAGHFLGRLSGFGFDTVIAFALAVLVYLVTEELLVEAHEEKETPVMAAFFFVSFLGILALDIAIGT